MHKHKRAQLFDDGNCDTAVQVKGQMTKPVCVHMQCAFYLKHQDLCAGKRNAYLTIFNVDNAIVRVSKGYQQMHLFSVFVTFCNSHNTYRPYWFSFFFHQKKVEACSEWLSKSLNFLFVNFLPFFLLLPLQSHIKYRIIILFRYNIFIKTRTFISLSCWSFIYFIFALLQLLPTQ